MSKVRLYDDKNAEILEYIEELNNIEDELTTKLEYAVDDQHRTSLEQSISLIQQTRINLSNALGGLNYYYTSNLENSSETLKQQQEAVAIIDREMQLAKARLGYINKQKDNKMRMVGINQYYNSYYKERTSLIKWVIVAIVVNIVFIYIRNRFVMVPSGVYTILGFLIIAYFAYNILMIILSISSRSKMVYDEYDWGFDKTGAPSWDPSSASANPFAKLGGTCFDAGCCDETTTFNKELALCVPKVSAVTATCSPAPVA